MTTTFKLNSDTVIYRVNNILQFTLLRKPYVADKLENEMITDKFDNINIF